MIICVVNRCMCSKRHVLQLSLHFFTANVPFQWNFYSAFLSLCFRVRLMILVNMAMVERLTRLYSKETPKKCGYDNSNSKKTWSCSSLVKKNTFQIYKTYSLWIYVLIPSQVPMFRVFPFQIDVNMHVIGLNIFMTFLKINLHLMVKRSVWLKCFFFSLVEKMYLQYVQLHTAL